MAWSSTGTVSTVSLPAESISGARWNLNIGEESTLLNKVARMPLKLVEVAERIYQGLATSADSIYVLTVCEEGTPNSRLCSRALGDEEVIIESCLLHPLLKGSEISRYRQPTYQYMVLFPYRVESGRAVPIAENEMRSKYPAAYNYLSRNKAALLKRSKTDISNWWLYPYPKNLSLYDSPKILSQVPSTRGNFALDEAGRFYFLGGGTAGGNAICVKDDNPDEMRFFLGILNSRLTTYLVSKVASGFRGGFFAFGKSSLASLPFPSLNLPDLRDAASHNQMVALWEQMLRLHQRLAEAQAAARQDAAPAADRGHGRADDGLVYELYGLTEEEIGIVEGG